MKLTLKGPVSEEMAPLILAEDRFLAAVAVEVAVGALVLGVGLATLAGPSGRAQAVAVAESGDGLH